MLSSGIFKAIVVAKTATCRDNCKFFPYSQLNVIKLSAFLPRNKYYFVICSSC